MSAWPSNNSRHWTKSWKLTFIVDTKKLQFQIDPDLPYKKNIPLTRGKYDDPNYFRLSESFVKKHLKTPADIFEDVGRPEKLEMEISSFPCRPRNLLDLIDIMRFDDHRSPEDIFEQFTEDKPQFFSSLWKEDFQWNWPTSLRLRLLDWILNPKYESFLFEKIPKRFHATPDDTYWDYKYDRKVPCTFSTLTNVVKYERDEDEYEYGDKRSFVADVWEFDDVSIILNQIFNDVLSDISEDPGFDEIKRLVLFYVNVTRSGAEDGFAMTYDEDEGLLQQIQKKIDSHDTLFTPNQNRSIGQLCTLFLDMHRASNFSKESIIQYRSKQLSRNFENKNPTSSSEPLDKFNRPILYALARYLGIHDYEELFWKVSNYTGWSKKAFDLVQNNLPDIFVEFVCVRYFATTFGFTSEIAANISDKAFSLHPLKFSKKEIKRNERKKAYLLHVSKHETFGGHKYGLWNFLTRDPELARCILDDYFSDVDGRTFLIDQIRLSVKLRKSFKMMDFESLRTFHFEKIKSWLIEHQTDEEKESLLDKELMYSRWGRPFSDDPRMNVQDLYLASEAHREKEFLEQARQAGKAKKKNKNSKLNRTEFAQQQRQMTFKNTQTKPIIFK